VAVSVALAVGDGVDVGVDVLPGVLLGVGLDVVLAVGDGVAVAATAQISAIERTGSVAGCPCATPHCQPHTLSGWITLPAAPLGEYCQPAACCQ
jgi:hypothetical protein